jgi:hypothetical protein
LALTTATASLLCAWTNTLAYILTCPSDAIATPATQVPIGTVVSYTSPCDANAQASALATALLHCTYTNDDLAFAALCPVSCTTGPIPTFATLAQLQATSGTSNGELAAVFVSFPAEGEPLNVAYYAWNSTTWLATAEPPICRAATYQANAVVPIPAGTTTSQVSKADANAQAAELATAQLNCQYCNKFLAGSCAAQTGSVPLTATDAANALYSVADSTYCAGDFETVYSLANSLNQQPAAQREGASKSCFWNSQTTTQVCPASPYYYSTAVTSVYLAAGVIQSQIDQATADQQAVTLALSLLNCIFANAQVILRCGTNADYAAIMANSTLLNTPYTGVLDAGTV